MFKQLFERRLNDKTLKIISILLLLIIIFPIYFTWMGMNEFREYIQKESDKKGVIVIDSAGTQFYTTIHEQRTEIYKNVINVIAKQQFTYNYLNYKEKLDYFKSFSSKNAYEKWEKAFYENNDGIEILKTSVKANIVDFVIQKENNNVVAHMIIETFRTSRTKQNIEYKLYVKYYLANGKENFQNISGIYITDFEFIPYDDLNKTKLEIFNKEK